MSETSLETRVQEVPSPAHIIGEFRDKLVGKLRDYLASVAKKYIYVKKSVGQYGQPIEVYKLKTMIDDADADVHYNKAFAGKLDAHGKPCNDPRITPAGEIMRRVWADELPQGVNLYNGYIKLVGIRPMTLKDWARYPQDVMEEAILQKPGWGGVNYAKRGRLRKERIKKRGRKYHPTAEESLAEHIDDMRQYLTDYKKTKTADLTYFTNIFFNILFGMRSS